jgi:hypothetical protein
MGGSDDVTCPTIFCGPRVTSIKKNLADLTMLLGMRVLKVRAHVFKMSDGRVIMGMQNV